MSGSRVLDFALSTAKSLPEKIKLRMKFNKLGPHSFIYYFADHMANKSLIHRDATRDGISQKREGYKVYGADNNDLQRILKGMTEAYYRGLLFDEYKKDEHNRNTAKKEYNNAKKEYNNALKAMEANYKPAEQMYSAS